MLVGLAVREVAPVNGVLRITDPCQVGMVRDAPGVPGGLAYRASIAVSLGELEADGRGGVQHLSDSPEVAVLG